MSYALNTGVAVAKMSIAVDRITKDEQGNYETDFFNVVAFRRTAEYAHQYLAKGRLIAVDGRLQQRSWIDQASGQKRSIIEVIADNIQGLERRTDAPASEVAMGDSEIAVAPPPAAAASAPPARAAAAPRTGGRNAPPPVEDDLDESDPFADE
jgi:single-strand DNA-binding protein